MEELKLLVIKSKAGDLEAYGRIVRRFQDMAFGYACSVLGDFHLAEDAGQEAFIEAFRQLPGLSEPDAFPGWFRQIIFTQCTSILRRKKKPTISLDAVTGIAGKTEQPADAAERREMETKVLEAIRALPEPQRVVTSLFYADGYSQAEIAGFLEVPVTTIQKRLHDARKKLKERMVAMVEETLKHNVPDEDFHQQVKTELLTRCFKLEHKENWRWVSAEPLNVARFRNEGREFVVRIYPSHTKLNRIQYHMEFIDWLRMKGLGAETVVLTSTNEKYVHLKTRESAMLLALDEGKFLPVPFDAGDAGAWGKLTGHLHTLSESWQPRQQVETTLLQQTPEKLINQAMNLKVGVSLSILKKLAREIISACNQIVRTDKPQPVHGMLGPPCLLKGPSGLQIVDVRYSGFGPPALDLATAFRWMPWKENPDRARSLWETWLNGYKEYGVPSNARIRSLPSLASLQCVYWLNIEVREALDRKGTTKQIRWYVNDHCKTIKTLMGLRGELS